MAALDVVVTLLFFIVPVGIMLVFVPKLLIRARNETNGCYNVLLLLSSIIILPLVMYVGSTLSPVFPQSLIFYLALTVFLLHAEIYFEMLISGMRLNKEDILLDLGRGKSRFYLFFVGLFLFILVPFMGIVMLQDEIDPESLTMVVMWFPFCLRYLIGSLSKIYLTEDGIFRFEGLIKWGYIRDYSWDKRKNDRLYLKIYSQVETTISVPADKQAEIDEIIKTRLGWHLRQDYSQRMAQA